MIPGYPSPLAKRHHLLALACYLAIPAVLLAGAALAALIDPELARTHDNYVRDYRWLELARNGTLLAATGLALALWLASCFLLLTSRRRSPLWLVLAAAGPFGFIVMAMLTDRAPAPADRYQQSIGKLNAIWRVALESVVFVAAWSLAHAAVLLWRELMIGYAAFSSGRSAASIVAEQNASGGMWAFGEALETLYLVVLVYLLWPMVFNLACRMFTSRGSPMRQDSPDSAD